MIQVLVAPQDVAAALAGTGEVFAALRDCTAASLGLVVSKKLLLHLPLGLSSSILRGCQTGSLPAGCAGVSLIWGLARGAVEQKTRALCCREPSATQCLLPTMPPFLRAPVSASRPCGVQADGPCVLPRLPPSEL